MDRTHRVLTAVNIPCIGCQRRSATALRNYKTIMKTLLYMIVLTQIPAAFGSESPFITRPEATQILQRRDLGRFRDLSAQFGLRSDISEGWEEILTPNYQGDIVKMIYSAIDPGWFTDNTKRHLVEKVLLGCVTGLRYFKTSSFQNKILH